MKKNLFLRADGSSTTGLGHIMRTLAIADMVKDTFNCIFVTRNPSLSVQLIIEQRCSTIILLPDTNTYEDEAIFLIRNHLFEGDIILLDGYQFGTNYQLILKERNCKIICVDDINAYHFVADIIINHAGGVLPEEYSKEQFTDCLFGIEYALLQTPFLDANRKDSVVRGEGPVLICLGGADPQNDTLHLLQECEINSRFEECVLVLGGAYLHREKLDEFLESSSLKVEIHSNISATEMVQLMQRCPVAVCPPSTVSYEYLHIGGQLYLHQIADNQDRIKAFYLKTGLAFDCAEFPASEAQIVKALQLQEHFFDGKSAARIKAAFQQLVNQPQSNLLSV